MSIPENYVWLYILAKARIFFFNTVGRLHQGNNIQTRQFHFSDFTSHTILYCAAVEIKVTQKKITTNFAWEVILSRRHFPRQSCKLSQVSNCTLFLHQKMNIQSMINILWIWNKVTQYNVGSLTMLSMVELSSDLPLCKIFSNAIKK